MFHVDGSESLTVSVSGCERVSASVKEDESDGERERMIGLDGFMSLEHNET